MTCIATIGVRYAYGTVRLLLTVGLFLLFSHILCTPVYATVTPYLINDAFTAPDHPFATGVGYVWYNKNIFLNYTGGKVFLSRNADGAGEMTVGDAIQVSVNSRSFLFRSSQNCVTVNKLQPVDITFLLSPGNNNIQVRYSEWCGNGDRFIDQAYIVHKDVNEYPVVPFLRLPWDYESKGLDFTNASLKMTSYFDHEYPFLSRSILSEPSMATESVITYLGGERNIKLGYSKHDGYDWGRAAKATYGELVLAAADGLAEYVNNCPDCGNAVHINHGNGYQTRYFHMQKDGLISQTPGEKIHVAAGQPIGKVGSTGNVKPKDSLHPEVGAHIHFMVVEDKNNDGNFDDNIPDGLVDPFGWQSKEPDPWENYEFSLFGQARKGNKSTYLWKDPTAQAKTVIPKTGGTIIVNGHKVTFPSGYLKDQGIVEVKATPMQSATETLRGLESGLVITVTDIYGNNVKLFPQPFMLIWSFAEADIINTDTSTLSLYSSNDGINWVKETTQIDLVNKKATAQINHLTEFALMGELKDTSPPTTEASVDTNNSVPQLILTANDNYGGIGVDYTLYKINENDWEKYTYPISLQGASSYEVQFYSVDNGENVEEIKTQTFVLDSTPPHTEAVLSGEQGNIGWYKSAVSLNLSAKDNEGGLGLKGINYRVGDIEWMNYEQPVLFETDGEYTVEFYATDLGENKEDIQTLHFYIDTTSPEAEIALNQTSYTLIVAGKDENPTTVTSLSIDKNKKEYTIEDKAGNSTKLVTTFSTLLDSIFSFSLHSLTYNANPMITMDKNVFVNTVLKNPKTKKLVSIAQVYTQKDKNVIGDLYTASDNKTRIYTYDRNNKELLKEIVTGMKLLQLYTEAGTLKYRY